MLSQFQGKGRLRIVAVAYSGLVLLFSCALPPAQKAWVPVVQEIVECVPGPSQCVAAQSQSQHQSQNQPQNPKSPTRSSPPPPLVCVCSGWSVCVVRPSTAGTRPLRRFLLPPHLSPTTCVRWIDHENVLLVGVQQIHKTAPQQPSIAQPPPTFQSTVAFANVRSGQVFEWKAMGATGTSTIAGCHISPSNRWVLVLRRKAGAQCDVEVWCMTTRKHMHTTTGTQANTDACWLPPSFDALRPHTASIDTNDHVPSPLGTLQSPAASTGAEQFVCVSADSTVQRFVIHTDGTVVDANERFRPNMQLSGVRCVGTCGKFLGLGDKEGNVVFVDLTSISKRVIEGFQSGRGPVHSIHFCPAANHIVLVCFVGRVVGVRDIQRSQWIALRGIGASPASVFWMPNGNVLCVSPRDGSLRIIGRGLDAPRPILQYVDPPCSPVLLGTQEAVLLQLHLTFPSSALEQTQKQVWKQTDAEFVVNIRDGILDATRDALQKVENASSRDSAQHQLLWNTLSQNATQCTPEEVMAAIETNFDSIIKDFQRSYKHAESICADIGASKDKQTIAETCMQVAQHFGDAQVERFWRVVIDTCARLEVACPIGSERDFAADPFELDQPISEMLTTISNEVAAAASQNHRKQPTTATSTNTEATSSSNNSRIPVAQIADVDMFPGEPDDWNENTDQVPTPAKSPLNQGVAGTSALFSDPLDAWFGDVANEPPATTATTASTGSQQPRKAAAGAGGAGVHPDDFLAIDLLDIGDDVPSPVLAPKRLPAASILGNMFDDDMEETALVLTSLREATTRPTGTFATDLAAQHHNASRETQSTADSSATETQKLSTSSSLQTTKTTSDPTGSKSHPSTTQPQQPQTPQPVLPQPQQQPQQPQETQQQEPQLPQQLQEPQEPQEPQPAQPAQVQPHHEGSAGLITWSDSDDTGGVMVPGGTAGESVATGGMELSDTEAFSDAASLVSGNPPSTATATTTATAVQSARPRTNAANSSEPDESVLETRDSILGWRDRWLATEQHTATTRSHITSGYHRTQRLVADQVRLGMFEDAVNQLVRSPLDHQRHDADVLLACVLAASISNSQFSKTVVTVAEQFFTSGRVETAVQLLCSVGESYRACCLLVRMHMWDEAVRLAKAQLRGGDYVAVMQQWAVYLLESGKEMDGVIVLLSVGSFGLVVQNLLHMNMADTAACLLFHLSQHFAQGELVIPTDLLDVVCLAYGRLLLQSSHLRAACCVLRWSRDLNHYRVLVSHLVNPTRPQVAYKSNPRMPRRTVSRVLPAPPGGELFPNLAAAPTIGKAGGSSFMPSFGGGGASASNSTSSHDTLNLKQQLGKVKSQTTSAAQAIGSKWLSIAGKSFRNQKDGPRSQVQP